MAVKPNKADRVSMFFFMVYCLTKKGVSVNCNPFWYNLNKSDY